MRCLFLCFILCISNYLIAQSDIKWGKIPQEDLAMTSYSLDSTAEAVILGDFKQAKFEVIGESYGVEYTTHKRIKILKESAFNWGDVEIYYQHYNKREKLLGLKAQIIQPDGSKISVEKKDIFRKEVSKYNTKVSFAFPQLQVGSVIEWTYNVNSLSYTFLDDKYFQYSIPCRSSIFFAELPEVFDYVQITQGPIKLAYEKESTLNNYRWGDEAVHYTYSASNVPALKREQFITTMDDYRSRLRFQLSAINIPGNYQPIMSDWIKVGDDLLDDADLGRQCFRKGNYNKILENLGQLKGTSQTEKLEEIFAFVTKKIEWNGSYGVYANESINKVFEKQSGNGAALNLITIALLNEQGIKASPALISTRTHGSPMPLYPVMRQFNHLLARVEIDDKVMFVDISDDLKSVECLRVNSLNGKAFVIEKGNSRWEDVIPSRGVDSYYIDAAVDEDGNISGFFKGRYLGYNTSPERRAFKKDAKGTHWQERMEEKYPEIEITDVTCKGLEDPSAPFTDGFNFTIEEAWIDSGDKIYLNPIMFTSQLTENPFKLEERTYPVDIPYPFKENYVFNLSLPEGYKAEIPPPTKVGLPNKAGRFTYTVTQTGNKIQLVANFSVNQLKFESDYYSALKSFYDLAIGKYEEQLVIVKE